MSSRNAGLVWCVLAGGCLVSAVSALADVSLPAGSAVNKPGHQVGANLAYSATLPSYCTPANQVGASLVSPITLPGPGTTFEGTVTSTAYRNPSSGLTFTYVFHNSGPAATAPDIVVATFSRADWLNAVISDVGSDAGGVSGNSASTWTDGDPYFISLGTDGLLEIDWRIGVTGTVLGGGDTSATIWLATDVPTARTGLVALADGGTVGQAQVLAAPEPLSLALVALGAGAGFCRRRSSRSC